MNFTSELIAALLSIIACLLGVFVVMFKGMAKDIGVIKQAVAKYEAHQEDHARRLQNIESRCMVHSGEIHDLHVMIGGIK